jgi:hypothetical protein
VHRLDNADTRTVGFGVSPTKVGDFNGPGPIAVDQFGRLYVASPWRAIAVSPWSLAITPGGTVYAVMRGTGMLVGDRR